MRATSVSPSPLGVNPDGVARTASRVSAAAGAPRTPVAGRRLGPAEIRYVYDPGGAKRASQVHWTVVPSPVPTAIGCRVASKIVTFHGSKAESWAEKLTRPPSEPSTTGAYSFGNPIAEARCAMAPSCPWTLLPGQLVKPVSRCPETARSQTGRPFLNRGFPLEIDVIRESGWTCATSSRQAISRLTAPRAAAGST